MTTSAAPAAAPGQRPARQQGATAGLLGRLLREVSWPEIRHHPWRHLAALLAVALGVALAFSVHLINESALGEFSAAVRQVNAQPDLQLRGPRGGFDEAVFERVATHPAVQLASPVVELDTYLLGDTGRRTAVRVLGVDALVAPLLAPALRGLPRDDAPRLAWIDPAGVWLNESARASITGEAAAWPDTVRLQAGAKTLARPVYGEVALDGPPVVVMDIAGAQASFERLGRLHRIDLRLVPGADTATLLRELALPREVQAGRPDDAEQRVSNLSRAYRVNLTVLALVALFTGAFLVFSVMALSVSRRLPQLALLGVLGTSARDRHRLIVAESAMLGVVGALAGLALGTGLAALALRWLSGDLGGAYFPGVRPTLQFSIPAAAAYGGLGVLAALLGGWMPARLAEHMAPAQALKGLGIGGAAAPPQASDPWTRRAAHQAARFAGPGLIAMAVALAFAPPIAGLPLAAYVSVALLLLGGIACVPWLCALLLGRTTPTRHPLAVLAVTRARHDRQAATIAVAGVVASLSLAVALTVMVSSFRGSILEWLDSVLPADLYARTATASAAADTVFLERGVVAQAAGLPGVQRVEAIRIAQVTMDPRRPPVVIVSRPLDDATRQLPLVGRLAFAPNAPNAPHPPGGAAAPAAEPPVPVYVSEAIVRLYGLEAGDRFTLPLPDGREAAAWVRGVWRDYARQHGAIVIDERAFRALTGDERLNDLAFWLDPGVDPVDVKAAVRRLAPDAGVEFATAREIREVSLRIFDRSFAVTYWLQAVAIGIGLFGIAASFSAQVLARRKEFGLLRHLGLRRREVLQLVAAEGAVWSALGALLGLALGLAVSVVLVHVVNPQSFNWTMPMRPPWDRLAWLCVAVVVAGTLTAWWAGRAAGRRDLALSVKEDW